METRLPPPLIYGIALLAVLALWYFAPALQIDLQLSIALAIAGIIFAVGLFIVLVAIGLFKRKDTTILPFDPDKTTALVTSGIYGITRNPMYLGMTLIVIAAAIAARQPLGLLAAFLACAYMTKFQIKPEERALEQSFGQSFVDYKARVRRWI